MSDDRLFRYFANNARYHRDAPVGSRYSIRLGSRSLFSDDTADLRKQFCAAVRQAKQGGEPT